MFTSVLSRSFWLAVALSATACGGGNDSPQPDPPPPGGSDVTTIRGNERLGWTQGAPSLQDVRAHTFVLYIDNARNSLLDVQCNDTGGTFACSGRLPGMTAGRHALSLAAIWNGVEGPRSSPIDVQVMGSEAPATAMAPGVATSFDGLITCMRGPSDCYEVRTVAAGVEGLAWPVATGDGRLLFVESEQLVRVVEKGVLQPEPALALGDADRIVGMAADARFDDTRAVFLTVSSDDGRGGRELRVVRYRDVQNTLGEAATLVSGIQVSDATHAPIAIGSDDHIYVAIPGRLLRFTSDGATPRDQAGATPVLARSFERPTALTIDRTNGRVWLAGTSTTAGSSIAMLAPPAREGAGWPTTLQPMDPADLGAVDEPFVGFARGEAAEATLHVIAAPTVYELAPSTRRDLSMFATLRLAGIARPLAIADGLDGERFVVAGSFVDQRATLLRLVPR